MYREVNGDLFDFCKRGEFDVVCQGNNCQNIQGGGIAPLFVKHFGTDKFKMESSEYEGDINKLGTIDAVGLIEGEKKVEYLDLENFKDGDLIVVNCYTQFGLGRNHQNGSNIPVDYDAVRMCFKKINYKFKGMRIGFPQICAGLGGADWSIISGYMKELLTDCTVTVVIYEK